ncbi:MAG: hypothetical protein KJ607_09805, partial [Bacteroidetes bacterium]|nr:hypothetical protein [Bacteroidota bacterium]
MLFFPVFKTTAQQFDLSEYPLNEIVGLSLQGDIGKISYALNGTLAIQLNVKKEQEIYIIKRGAKTVQKVEMEGLESEPCLNRADGNFLAFTGTDAEGNSDIYLADLEKKSLSRITNTAEIETQPSLDNNAAIIAYSVAADQKSLKKGDINIAYRVISTKETKVITDKETNNLPSLCGDGSALIYCNTNPSTFKKTLFIYRIGDGSLTKVASSGGSEFYLPQLNDNATKALYIQEGASGSKALIHELELNMKKGIKQSELAFPCFGRNDSTIVYFGTDEGYIPAKSENPYTKEVKDIGLYLKEVYTMQEDDFSEIRSVRYDQVFKTGGDIGLDVSENGTVAIICNDTAYVFLPGEERGLQISADDEEVSKIRLNEDGKRAVFSSLRKGVEDIICIDFPSKKRINVSSCPQSGNSGPDIDAKGEFICYTSDRDGNENIFLANLTTRETRQMSSSLEDETDAAIFPDGSAVAYIRRSKDKQAICMKEVKKGAQEQELLKSPANKYKELRVAGNKLVFTRETSSK